MTQDRKPTAGSLFLRQHAQKCLQLAAIAARLAPAAGAPAAAAQLRGTDGGG
jgi:hypothetical protein